MSSGAQDDGEKNFLEHRGYYSPLYLPVGRKEMPVQRILAVAFIVVFGSLVLVARLPQTERDMAAAASALLGMLDQDQLATIRWPFDSEERFNWHFVPRQRQGLSLKTMNDRQREAAFTLLRTGLSAKGFSKVEAIRSLENVLRAIEGSANRDPELYFFTIFGDPSSGTWAWRYEGHHISQNWTIARGKAIATTPAFLGANPADVRDGELKGTRPLGAEEDLARALLNSLTETQRSEAVTAAAAPADIITSNSRKAAIAENSGLLASSMTKAQQGMLMSLIEEHAASQPAPLAEMRLAKVRADGLARIRFAWMGATEKGGGHYYRVQGDQFVIEYDNVQNGANHHHIVWRDFAGDFGVDVLEGHHAHDPEHAKQR